MITFRPIDSGYLNVNIISRIVGTGLGDYDPLVQVDVIEGVATLLAGLYWGL